MKLYPIKQCKKGCDADVVAESVVLDVHPVLCPGRRAKQVHHYRQRDEARFWHWSDQKVVRI